MLRAFVAAVFAAIIAMGMIYVGDITVAVMGKARSMVANATGVNETTRYGAYTNDVVGTVAWSVLLILGGILLVYSIHVRRR